MPASVTAHVTYGFGFQKREGGKFEAKRLTVGKGSSSKVLITIAGDRDPSQAKQIYCCELELDTELAAGLAGLLSGISLGNVQSTTASL